MIRPDPELPQLPKPIFIIGSGRCGSTILHKAFTYHPQIAFLSGLCKMYPDRPGFNRLAMHMMDVPLLHWHARKKFRPAEHWEFWDHHLRGFSAPCRDLVADDVRPHNRAQIRDLLSRMLTRRRDRLLVKLTGWPRVGYLSEIFPDALFIHLIRDGRAVVNSLLDIDFWQGWRGPQYFTWGNMTSSLIEEWDCHDKSFVALAALQWKSLMDVFEGVRASTNSSRFLTIRYEDFTEDPRGVFGQILQFCQLDYPQSFRDSIDRLGIHSMNYKWRSNFTDHQISTLNDCLKEHLIRYGYSTSDVEAVSSRKGEVNTLKI